MQGEYYTVITRIGQAKIANAIALGRTLQIKYMAIGDGGGNSYEPDDNQTELRREVYRAQVSSIAICDASINKIRVSMLVPDDVGGFTIREAGLYDADGDLITVTKTPVDPKPALETGAAKDMQYNIDIIVSNMAAIELKVDPTVIIATKAELTSAVQAAKKESKEYTDAQVTEIKQTLGSGLVVFAGAVKPTTELTDYLWLQVLNSRSAEIEPTMLVTSAETASGYHIEIDKRLEHIDNAVADADQAKADDVIILEV